jgi:hypothetical protein
MVKRTLFDAVAVSYLTDRAIGARDGILEVSLEAVLEEAAADLFSPLFVTDDLYRHGVGGLHVLNDVIYAPLPDTFLEITGERTGLPRSSIIIEDARPSAFDRLRYWAATGLAVGAQVFVPAPLPCARIVYHGSTKVTLHQFASDETRWGYDGFLPDRKASHLYPFSSGHFLPLNMADVPRATRLVDGLLRIGGERTTPGAGALHWRNVVSQRPDLIPRQSEVHAAAVTGQLIMGLACTSSQLPVEPEGLELGAACIRNADLTLLGLREPEMLGAALRYFRQDHADCFGPHRIHRGLNRMLDRCLFVVENGERIDEALSGATLQNYAGTDAYEQYRARKLVDSDDAALSVF